MVLFITGPNKSGKKTLAMQLKNKGFIELTFHTQIQHDCIINNTINNRYFTIIPDISLIRDLKIRPFFTFMVIIPPSQCEWRNENDIDFYFDYFMLKKEGILRKEEIILNYDLRRNELVDSTVKEVLFIEAFDKEINLEHRMSFTDYFIKLAYEVSLRSNCVKRRIGALIVKEKKIISTGYNGSPFNTKNCYEGGCKRCISNIPNNIALDYCVCIHAEENAILNVSVWGCKDSELYTTHFPCQFCARKIIQCGIKSVFYVNRYSKDDCCVEEMFKEGGVQIYQVEQKYL